MGKSNPHPRSNIHSFRPSELHISPEFNGRNRPFSPASVRSLAESLAKSGQLQPVSVLRIRSEHLADFERLEIPAPPVGSLLVVFGNRRATAARYGVENGILPEDFRVKGIMFPGSIVEAVEANAAENRDREDTNALDQAKSVRHLIALGKSKKEAMKAAGVTGRRFSAASFLRLLLLPSEIQDEIQDGKLVMEVASNLVAIKSDEELLAAYHKLRRMATVDGNPEPITAATWRKFTKQGEKPEQAKEYRVQPPPRFSDLVGLIKSTNAVALPAMHAIVAWYEGRLVKEEVEKELRDELERLHLRNK